MHPAPPALVSLSHPHGRLFFSSIAALAGRNLSRHRRRTVVNALGIAVAVGSLIFFQAFYRGSYEELMFGTIIDYQCAHVQVQTDAFVDEDPDSWGSERALIAGWQDLRQRVQGAPGVRGASARLVVPAFAGNGVRKRAILLTGVAETADRAVMRTLERIVAGRRLSGPGEVLVGASLAKQFGLKPGDQLKVQVRTVDDVPNVQAFTIAGLFATGYGQIDRGTAVTALPDLQELVSAGDRVNRIFVRASSIDRVESVRTALSGMLSAPLAATTWTEFASGILEHSRTDRLFMIVFLCILLGLSLSTVAGTMYMAVFERTREIGSLRAMGWQRPEVFRLFLVESSLIGVAGAALGLLGGGALSLYFGLFPIDTGAAFGSLDVPFLKMTCRLTGADAAVSALAGVGAALIAGISPARRAARIEIVKALAAR